MLIGDDVQFAFGRENQAVKWCTPRQLFDLDMPAADKPLIAPLRDTI